MILVINIYHHSNTRYIFVHPCYNVHKFHVYYMIVNILNRAKLYGWHDTYSFTKAIGEMVIDIMREDIPTVIIRPSAITTSYEEPFPGWIQGFRSYDYCIQLWFSFNLFIVFTKFLLCYLLLSHRVFDPLIIFYGKGEYPCALCDPNCLIDVVGILFQ